VDRKAATAEAEAALLPTAFFEARHLSEDYRVLLDSFLVAKQVAVRDCPL